MGFIKLKLYHYQGSGEESKLVYRYYTVAIREIAYYRAYKNESSRINSVIAIKSMGTEMYCDLTKEQLDEIFDRFIINKQIQ